jgi:TRAP transporter TAXI family solute receptor
MRTVLSLVAAVGMIVSAGATQAKDFYKLGSLAPGMTPFTVNTAFATIVNKHLKDVEIQVSATGTAMRHQLLVAKGRMDFFMSAPIGQFLMEKQIGPFKRLKNGKELSARLRQLFAYEIGPYHFVTYADSGITDMKQLKGKKVFIGPPGGAATRVVAIMIKAQTGLVAGKDYEKLNMGWSAAIQAFQDKKYDVMVIPTNPPSPAIQQIALTSKLRLLSVDISRQGRLLKTPGRTIRTIDPTVYGKNMVTRKPVTTLGALVGIGVRADMPADVVYRITKAFWEHVGEAYGSAVWMKSAVNLKNALVVVPHGLHPGAARYYKEKGLKIPPTYQVGQKWDARAMTFKAK